MACLKPKGLVNFTKEFFLQGIKDARSAQGTCIENFDFNKSRCRILTEIQEIKEDTKGIMYWMNRDCRVQDNWAMLFSQKLARKNNLPLYVCVFLKDSGKIFTKRHLKFFTEGLESVENECKDLNIHFSVFNTTPDEIVNLVKKNDFGAVICEFNPLRKQIEWQDKIKEELPSDVPLVQVDAHNIVPAWIASDKQEHMARTIRPKILKKLPEYLTGFPQMSSHEHTGKELSSELIIPLNEVNSVFPVEGDVTELSWAIGGPEPGLEMLRTFMLERLSKYGETSNDPSKDAQSHLSSWLNFGHISAQRVALEVKTIKDRYGSQVEKYLEELIIRRELTDNYCYYNKNYDNLTGASEWAQKSLNEHRKDKREYLYTKEQFIKAESHDEIWNAAQLQLLQEGKIHGYMRMYWCKKILEWTKSPEEAIEFGLYLNDYYSLDGSDPNGFVGVMWSVCGVHDQGWKERPVFGKIRYMVDYSLRRKVDIDSYIARYVRNPRKTDKKPEQKNKASKGAKRKHSE